MRRRHWRALTGLLIVLSCGAHAGAQETVDRRARTERAARIKRDAAGLHERARDLMHPGRPLDLIGNEQGDNSFRDDTPGLARSENLAALVDADENYARRIAMYEGGRSFSTPLKVRASPGAVRQGRGPWTREMRDARDAQRAHGEMGQGSRPEPSNGPLWWSIGLLSVAFVALRRCRGQ